MNRITIDGYHRIAILKPSSMRLSIIIASAKPEDMRHFISEFVRSKKLKLKTKI